MRKCGPGCCCYFTCHSRWLYDSRDEGRGARPVSRNRTPPRLAAYDLARESDTTADNGVEPSSNRPVLGGVRMCLYGSSLRRNYCLNAGNAERTYTTPVPESMRRPVFQLLKTELGKPRSSPRTFSVICYSLTFKMRVPLPALFLLGAAFASECWAAKHHPAASVDPAAMALLQSPLFEPLSGESCHSPCLQLHVSPRAQKWLSTLRSCRASSLS